MLTGNNRMEEQDPRRSWVRKYALVTEIVVCLVGYTGAGIAIGYIAWEKWGAPWWVLLLFSLAGLGLAMYRVYQLSQKEF